MATSLQTALLTVIMLHYSDKQVFVCPKQLQFKTYLIEEVLNSAL
jgi:hypothetical protein